MSRYDITVEIENDADDNGIQQMIVLAGQMADLVASGHVAGVSITRWRDDGRPDGGPPAPDIDLHQIDNSPGFFDQLTATDVLRSR